MSHRSIFFGLIFAIGLFVIARMEYYPKSGMFEAMGMTGPRANSGRRCFGVSIWRLLQLGAPRSEFCTGASVLAPPIAVYNENVVIDPITHEIKHAQTAWTLGDSVQWGRKVDSIFTSLTRRGGHLITCNTTVAQSRFADAYYWKFPDFYLKVHARKVEQYFRSPMKWFVGIEGFKRMPYECMNRPF